MNINGPKVKISRRLGIPITPKASKIMQKKAYPPGQQGANRRRAMGKMSNFKRQLLEKQKLRAQYNIQEKQMSNYYKKAASKEGNTEDNLIQMLESRLDCLVLRAGLAKTIYAARQYVAHGHILVNGQRVDIPSYNVRIGDTISVKEKSRQLPCFIEAVSSGTSQGHLEVSKESMEAKMLNLPAKADVPIICEVNQVIEYYSR